MKQFQVFIITLLLVIMVPALAERNEDSIRSAIQHQISQRHPSLPTGFWENLGPEALPVIKKMYAESGNANEKSFLIDGLAHFGDSSTGSFLEHEVATTQNEVLKKKLLSAVIQSEGESSFDFVEPYLKDSDAHIRLSVASGLTAFEQSEKIQRRLAEFRSKEKTPWVLAELKKTPSSETLQKPRKIMDTHAAQMGTAVISKPIAETTKVVSPLPEKSWAGLWRGSYVTENKMILVEANLILLDASSVPMKWKVEYKLPKQVKQDWKNGEFTLNYFQTNRAHWIEIRNPKMDTVFLAQRKVN